MNSAWNLRIILGVFQHFAHLAHVIIGIIDWSITNTSNMKRPHTFEAEEIGGDGMTKPTIIIAGTLNTHKMTTTKSIALVQNHFIITSNLSSVYFCHIVEKMCRFHWWYLLRSWRFLRVLKHAAIIGVFLADNFGGQCYWCLAIDAVSVDFVVASFRWNFHQKNFAAVMKCSSIFTKIVVFSTSTNV